jgi:pimeloyl-ACP methyl ester carboxylesterase
VKFGKRLGLIRLLAAFVFTAATAQMGSAQMAPLGVASKATMPTLAANPDISTVNSEIAKVKLEPCEVPSLKETDRCGKLEVFEDRDAKSGRKIALNILVLPALSPNPKPDPVFYLEGGPGGSAVASGKASPLGKLFKAWQADRDVVFVDQRGTGESNPLRCEMETPDDMSRYFGENELVRFTNVTACRDKLSQVADLKLYTTPIAMDDLDDVRQALGYDKINLFGGSYGTRAALVYIRQHGDHVRAAVLDGVAPTNFKLPLPFAKGVQNALNRLFADCAADPACHKAFPDVKSDFEAALALFDKGPVSVTAFNTVTKKPQQFMMTRGAFVDAVRLLLYDPQSASLLPLFIHQAAQGNFGGIASLGYFADRQLADIMASGMNLSVICAEDAPVITESDVRQATEGTYYGDYRVKAMLAECKDWPRGKVAANYTDPVRSDVPVLIISGDVDPVTPPWLAADAVHYLSHGRQIVGKNWSHSSISDCGNRLIADFISRGSADTLDAACMQAVTRPAFNTGEVALAPKEHAAGTVKTSYEGILAAGGQKIRLVVNLFKAPDGSYSASLDSPDQGAEGLKVDVVTLKDGALHLDMKQTGISYDGKMSADGSAVDGEFKQGALNIPLQFKKKD